ncbi:DoxX family protein [Elizabethkingia anophelis]|nr:DoxX family protein [Elizabethkingia anophelis]MCT4062147.1 DoxX family protein [Elizabethkingia anophelis]MCT4108438.1 DoxX family protein [Elizabethkingia anophelis]MCT4137102.1 DoxX family protein [Elizabethkingia anophelis]
MKNLIIKTRALPLVIPRLTVGFIFLSEGMQKFTASDAVGIARFTKIGFHHPEFWVMIVGITEIVCSILLLIGLISRLASIPLLIIMIVAFITTKIPIFIQKGCWVFAHEYRTDFAMTMLLIMLFYYGSGSFSIDKYIEKRGERE